MYGKQMGDDMGKQQERGNEDHGDDDVAFW